MKAEQRRIPTEPVHRFYDDTVELELTQEEMELLKRASTTLESAQAAPQVPAPPPTLDFRSWPWSAAPQQPVAAAKAASARRAPATASAPTAAARSSSPGTRPPLAATEKADGPNPSTAGPADASSPAIHSGGSWRMALAAGIAVVVISIGAIVYHGAHASPQPSPSQTLSVPASAAQTSAPAATGTAAAEMSAAGMPATEPSAQPVRYKNPFDRSEVFEFPPGTSDADVRQQVADILLQRAQDRKDQHLVPSVAALRKKASRPSARPIVSGAAGSNSSHGGSQ